MPRYYQTISFAAIFCMLIFLTKSLACLAENLPPYYDNFKEVTDVRKKLVELSVLVNGERIKVKNLANLSFVRGDILKIEGAVLNDSSTSGVEINLIGFLNRSRENPGIDDTGAEIDSSILSRKNQWGQGEGKNIFTAVVTKDHFILGKIYLEGKEPVLEYIEILVNGEKKTLGFNEQIKLRKSDQFKVLNVVTDFKNSEYAKSNVLIEVHEIKNKNSLELYEISVKHRNYVFATIPVTIEKA